LSERERAGASDLAQSALFEQVTNVLRALAAEHPLLLLLDDLQWADAGSISLLFHLGRRLEGTRLLIVCACRSEEVALGRDGERHPLEKVLTEFKRSFGDVWVDLTRVDETEGRRFVDEFLNSEPNRLGEDFRRGMLQHTGGHPMFTIELLRAMQERGDLVQDERGRWVEGPELGWEMLPARVEAVIEARVGRLKEGLRDVLAVASVEGERFTAQVVAQVLDIPKWEMLRALSQELGARHRLVQEGEEVQVDGRFLSRYQFAHALFQAYLYNGLSTGERRLLHGEIAAALEELYGDQTAEIAVHLAHHYDEAGRAEKAVEYSLRAGDQAHRAYANEEASAYFRRALELLDEPALARSRKDWRVEALRRLGQIYFETGKVAEAEERFREAIALGQEMGLAPRELVRLYSWLGEALWWQSRFDELIRTGEEGLALLGDDTESTEAALMNQNMAMGHWARGNWERHRELTYRTARFIQRLPYSEELRPAHSHIVITYLGDKDVEEAMKWVLIHEGKAIPHHDLRALWEARWTAGVILLLRGDLYGAISRSQQVMEFFTRIGDAKLESLCLLVMGEAFLSLGDLHKAEEYMCRGLEAAKAVRSEYNMALTYCLIGHIFLSQGAGEKAMHALQKAVQLLRELRWSWGEAWATSALGRAHLAQGDRVEALNRFREALALAGPEGLRGYRLQHHWTASTLNPLIASAASGLEEAQEDPAAFRAFCRRFREEHPKVGDSPFTQWFLEPTDVSALGQTVLHHDEFAALLLSDWDWQDIFDDCSFTVRNGLEIHAANGRHLWHANLSAPRMLRSASGDLAVQTVCAPASDEKPVIGGLVLWKDKENYLRLDRGTTGEHDVFFGGCLGNQDLIIGRGRLFFEESANQRVSESSGRVFLRLERVGDRVDALCSRDGERWLTVGHVVFSVEDPVQVGLYAIGNIDRAIYHGAYSDGTAIRFESFQLWRLNH
jgi:tetratricopeptide (TPR) repeat protein